MANMKEALIILYFFDYLFSKCDKLVHEHLDLNEQEKWIQH